MELARHIGVVLHEEKTTVLSHPTVSYFIHLLCSDMVDPPVGSEVTFLALYYHCTRGHFLLQI